MPSAAVSCVIPVFNGERFIGEAIESARRQTLPLHEIIIIDDGSEDGTADLVSSLGADIRYFRQDNRGASSARRHGASRASGDFIAFLDADDLWRPHKTAVQLTCMKSQARLGACTTYMQNFWMADVDHERGRQAGDRLTTPQPGVASTVMLRSTAYHEVAPLDDSLRHRDIQDLLIRLRAAGWQLETLHEVLVDRRIHDRNVSRNRGDKGEQELLDLAAAALARRRTEVRG